MVLASNRFLSIISYVRVFFFFSLHPRFYRIEIFSSSAIRFGNLEQRLTEFRLLALFFFSLWQKCDKYVRLPLDMEAIAANALSKKSSSWGLEWASITDVIVLLEGVELSRVSVL